MTIIDTVFTERTLPDSARAFLRDRLTLGWEDRIHHHARRRTDGGIEFGTSLPRGSVLRDGDRFVLDAERVVVSVVERPEPVFVVEPRSAPEFALFAYHIGNRHQPVMITDRLLVCPDAPGVEQTLMQHQMPYVRATLPFTPVVGAQRH